MRYDTLPENLESGDKNQVKITNRKLDPKAEKGTEILVDAERFIYPQIESVPEAIETCGGEEGFLRIFNSHLRDSAVGEGKNRIRMATTGDLEEIINSGLSITKNFTFVEQASISASEAKAKFADLRNLVSAEDLSDEELAAKVRSMFKL
jgi:hypothetical protein